MTRKKNTCCGAGSRRGSSLDRRQFLKTSLGSAVLASYGDLAFSPKMVYAGEEGRAEPLIPADKGLGREWRDDLTRRTSAELFRGWDDQLQYIGMPIGGIGCGQLYLGGDGRLWLWDIFKSNYERDPDHGERIDSMGAGGHYAKPVAQGELYSRRNGAEVEQGFALRVRQAGRTITRALDHRGFPDVTFRGEYPVGKVDYRDSALPVELKLEAFSPFVPLNARDSALPATVMSYRLRNTSTEAVQVAIVGWLQNATCPYTSDVTLGQRKNEVDIQPGRYSLISTVSSDGGQAKLQEQHGYGSMALSLLSADDDFHVSVAPRVTATENLPALFEQVVGGAKQSHSAALDEPLVGGLCGEVTLQPGEVRELDFLITWYFPEYAEYRRLSVYRFYGPADFADARRHYAARFSSALEVAEYVLRQRDSLLDGTRLWNETWYDSSLPHWLLDRSFIAIDCVATQMFHWFDNGRPYAWEGVDCCPGTCTHVWHYAQGLGRVFPELERLFRERVDYGIGFNENSGEISARGEIPVEKSAVDGQAGTILRVYREHQMSADSQFLQRLWPRVKQSALFLMAQDTDGSGLLRGRQYNTLDAAWYGPMGWISSLYLAALAAAQAMAVELGDSDFARQCGDRIDRGRDNMVSELFNGEYFIHKPDPDQPNAIRSGIGCHIDQVLGQAWTRQVSLPRVIPKPETVSALDSLWRYNFAPDAGQYAIDNTAIEPAFRVYAMPGEAGLVMCSWPRGGAVEAIPDRKWFGFAADEPHYRSKENPKVWTGPGGYFNECMNGFEYQVAAHMVSEGEPGDELVGRGLAITRAVHDRYGAQKRNPYNEIECSDHYARSMASYGVFVAVCGFEYHGPRGHIGFAPKVNPQNFRSAFIAAEGWGSYQQTVEQFGFEARLELAYGSLDLNTISLELSPGQETGSVLVDGRPVSWGREGSRVLLDLGGTLEMQAGQQMTVTIS